MNDDSLSQEEINGLLEGLEDGNDEQKVTSNNVEEDGYPPPTTKAGLDVSQYLTTIEQDTIGEIGNISFGSAATVLSKLLNQKVSITTPVVQAIQSDLLYEELPKQHVAVHVKYMSGFKGTNLLVIKEEDARVIADFMLGGDGTSPPSELTDMYISAVQEAMNQMMGSSSTSLSTIFNRRVDISPPAVDMLNIDEGSGTEYIPQEDTLVKTSFRLQIGDQIDSSIMQLASLGFAKEMVAQLMAPNPKGEENLAEELGNTEPPEPSPNPQPSSNAPLEEGVKNSRTNEQVVDRDIQPVTFNDFDDVPLSVNQSRNLSMLMDIPLEVTVELGRTRRSIKDILQFTQGSIIELDKLAGDPVDILVNQRLVAKGEVVVIDENFGVRVTDIISREQRLQHL
ncbi:flagellar motor switch protein FliN/FliY [Geomicrobium halophilum]|uniref:Flagellar motor switch protein FliN/FliY n=1 Tax=Geomicrobium halophilum TaxID=549000 RepID=A0A841PSL3_9BACL|nr:flagellar motor switch phosphatase FliY [Geomicrobium halophilum]MBB6449291.1 flagellar motor switch protein FliN/FliY [Geomicrobium halophilum]